MPNFDETTDFAADFAAAFGVPALRLAWLSACPADWVHSSYLPRLLPSVSSRSQTRIALHRMLAEQFELQPLEIECIPTGVVEWLSLERADFDTLTNSLGQAFLRAKVRLTIDREGVASLRAALGEEDYADLAARPDAGLGFESDAFVSVQSFVQHLDLITSSAMVCMAEQWPVSWRQRLRLRLPPQSVATAIEGHCTDLLCLANFLQETSAEQSGRNQ